MVSVNPTSPDKAGVTTSEFWVTIATLVGSAFAYFGNKTLGGSLHDLIVSAGPAAATLYIACRTWIKSIMAKSTSPTPSTPPVSG